MSLQIIIKKPGRYGKSRAEQEANLRRDGYRSMDEATFDKAKWIEKRTGYKGFLPQTVINGTKNTDGT